MTEQQPKLSVLIPVYNTAQYLARCLDSVLNQSMTDLEIIAVDDASPDESASILLDYAKRDSRVRIVTHEKNLGILGARVSGIRAARGKYVTFLDADDLLAEKAMALAWEKAESSGADIVHFATRVFDESDDHSAGRIRKAEGKLKPYHGTLKGRDIFDRAFLELAYRWTIWGKLYRKSLCEKAADLLPPGYYLMAEDFCFYTLISFHAEHYEPLDFKGYLYFLNAGVSAYSSLNYAGFKRRCSIFSACRAVRRFLTEQGVFEKYAQAFLKQEDLLLSDIIHRWRRNLDAADRRRAFELLFQSYDAPALLRAFHASFGRDHKALAHLLTGSCHDKKEVMTATRWGAVAEAALPEGLSPDFVLKNIPSPDDGTLLRMKAFEDVIKTQNLDVVVLSDTQDDSLLWDVLFVRSAGAAVVIRSEKSFSLSLSDHTLGDFLAHERILSWADMLLVEDDISCAYWESRGVRCIVTNCMQEGFIAKLGGQSPTEAPFMKHLMQGLQQCDHHMMKNYVIPGADGESFVGFYRKLDKVFRKVPEGPRKKTAVFLADIYLKIFGE